MATRFLPNFDKGAEPPICRIIFSIIAIFHKGLVQISFSLSSPTLRHYQNMKLKIDWAGLVKALLKAAWPFIAGAVGGIVSGCAWGGNGPNFFA